MLDEKVIGGKKVYLVDAHHHVLIPWARHRGRPGKLRCVISLDEHPDALQPFQRYCNKEPDEPTSGVGRAPDDIRKLRHQCLAQLDPRDESSIVSAIERLCNDEHVQTAAATRIISAAFVISRQATTDNPRSFEEELQGKDWLEMWAAGRAGVHLPDRPHYPPSPSGMYIVGLTCVPECDKQPHDDACVRLEADAALETPYLKSRLDVLDRMAECNKLDGYRSTGNYILDIDLDYCRTRKAIKPADGTLFAELVRGAEVITVAREAKCVATLALDIGLTASWLENELLALIKQALA